MEPSYPELNDTFHDVSESAYGEEDAFRRTLEIRHRRSSTWP